jgi:hypothetical protein
MGLKHHPKVVTNGLFVYYDAANTRSYSGSGVTVNNLFSGFGCTLVNGPTQIIQVIFPLMALMIMHN